MTLSSTLAAGPSVGALLEAALGTAQGVVAAPHERQSSEIPAPPFLLRPGLLDPWTGERKVRAERSLETWVAEFASKLQPENFEPLPPRDAEARASATRLYVQGRVASLEGRDLVAAQKFESALFIDPDSADILVAYARLLGRMGNASKANELYARLLQVDPSRPEALLTMGLQAAGRGQADLTVATLGRLLADPATCDADERAELEEFWGSLRPEALLAAEISLLRALNDLGADAAILETLDRSFARGEPEFTGPAAIECRRVAGDARARRGDVAGAMLDWREGLSILLRLSKDDLALAPLAARLLWAETSVGTSAMATLRRLVDTTGVHEEWIALASWLASVPDATAASKGESDAAMAGANTESERRAFAATVDVRIGDPRSARLAAALVPSRAFERLAASHDRRHPDRAHIAAWLRAAARGSSEADATATPHPQRVVDLALNILDDCAAEPDVVIDGLLSCGLDAPSLLALVASSDATPMPARRRALQIRLLAAFGRTAEAWTLGHEGRGDPAILRALLSVAVFTQRVEAIQSLASAIAADDIGGQIELLRAYGMKGELANARTAADRVLAAAAAQPNHPDRRAEAIAHSLLGAAMVATMGQGTREPAHGAGAGIWNDQVTSEWRAAIAADPTYEPAWIQLLSFTRMNSRPLNSSPANARGPSKEEAALRTELLEMVPDSPLSFSLRREALVAQGRSGEAIEAVLAKAESMPWDESLLKEAIAALSMSNRTEEALSLLDRRISITPGSPIVWQLWTDLIIADGQAEEALDRLQARIDQPQPDPIAQSLVSRPLRALQRHAEADAAEEAQRQREAPSVRREIARIAQFTERGETEKAIEALRTFASTAKDLGSRECFAGLELALRLPTDGTTQGEARRAARDEFIQQFANILLERGDDPATAADLEPAAMVRAAGALALVWSRPNDGTAEGAKTYAASIVKRLAMANRAVAALSARTTPLDRSGASVWLDLAQRFADQGSESEGSDFLGSLATSDIRMEPDVAARIATACFALDAAAGGRSDRSVALLDIIRLRGIRAFAGRDRVVERDSDELYLLSGIYSLVHDREGSNAILRVSLERDPNHAMSLNNLGWDLLEHEGVTPEAASMIERAHAAMPNEASILDSIGWLRYRQGRFEEARDLLSQAIAASKGEPSVETLDHFGDAAMKTGLREKAIEAWREVGRMVETFYGRKVIMERIPTYEMNEHGVRVIDAAALWQRNYGNVAERAATKLREAEAQRDEVKEPVGSGSEL
ncbi:MAG: hypothetical protein JNL80_12990 [Phycisphaerae bacterium]|nr:hypothetical protein [Phycisphaerae bacterium]